MITVKRSIIIAALLVACGGSAGKPRSPTAPTTPLEQVAPAVAPAVPFPGPAQATRETRLLRFPDIHGDLVVFTYAGDLWLVRKSGGTASRLTAHPGLELFAKFSPDGKWIAFTGQYGGDEQVYVIPTSGGEPRQLTFYPAVGPMAARWGYDNQICGWTPDGSIVFRSMRESVSGDGRLFVVAPAGGMPTALPMRWSGIGEVDASGTRLVYSPLFRDFRTWKRYRGGWAQDLYLFDLEHNQATRLTTDPGTDRDPMWLGEQIYFASDRDGIHNIYRFEGEKRRVVQVTSFEQWDVRWPSSDGASQIIFERNGELHLLETADGAVTRVPVYVPDDGARTRPELVDASKQIEDFELGPTGRRVAITARGDVFSVPVEHGPVRNLTHSSNAHERAVTWSADGKEVAFVSDWSGEEQIWLAAADGSSSPRRLSSTHQGRIMKLVWSPDGTRIAHCDHSGRLYVVTIATGAVTEVARDRFGDMQPDYSWSPDSAFLAYTLRERSGFSSIHVWSAGSSASERVTSELWNDFGPVWHPAGQHLYFFSDREHVPQLGWRELNFVSNKPTCLFALALTRSSPNPFGARNDVAGSKDDSEAEDGAKKPAKKPAQVVVRIDFDGLGERVARVPVPGGNYSNLVVTTEFLVYGRSSTFFWGREPEGTTALMVFSLAERKAQTLVDKLAGWSLSRDGKHALVKDDKGGFRRQPIVFSKAAQPAPDLTEHKVVDLKGLRVRRVASEEWQVIFNEVWRRFRDYFYVANMHGHDWKALGDKYRPLLAHVGHRSDLNYVMGEMIAELSVSHAYVSGGDEHLPARPPAAMLGGHLELDPDARLYRIAEVLTGDNAEPLYRSPLTEVGVHVDAGDYLLAINGRPLLAADNPYELLQLPADKPLELTVSSTPAGERRRILLMPIASEANLHYLRWTERNRRHVAKASNGRVGYLHLPDMGVAGLREFSKWYYGQVKKDGLIIDVRSNGGGFASQTLIDRLRRTRLAAGSSRHSQEPDSYPATVFTGHMVTLISETSASDGDIFPYMFRAAGLGPLIGKRTWGGVIGISYIGPLLDGGEVWVPGFGYTTMAGEWIIEGKGVAPDIEVENDPALEATGVDSQLERAIEEVMKKLENDPRPVPKPPVAPVKTR